MDTMMQTVLAGVFTACAAAATASAQERPIELAIGPGREAVEAYCSPCDSLDYLTLNSSILDDRGWTTEVKKMIDVFGAPISPYQTKIIVDYLVKNYGTGADVH